MKKQKLVIPKNIISFQPKEHAEAEKPKATIVRKVYVKRSRELVKKVAAQGAEEAKLKSLMVKVHSALDGLETRAIENAQNDESKEMLVGHSDKTSLRQESIPTVIAENEKEDQDLLDVLGEIAESCNNKQNQEPKIKCQESVLLSTEFNLTQDVCSPLQVTKQVSLP